MSNYTLYPTIGGSALTQLTAGQNTTFNLTVKEGSSINGGNLTIDYLNASNSQIGDTISYGVVSNMTPVNVLVHENASKTTLTVSNSTESKEGNITIDVVPATTTTSTTSTSTTSTSTSTTSTTTTLPSETTCNSCSDCSSKLDGSYDRVYLNATISEQSGSCITFGASNVELDCQGRLINGTHSGSGVYMSSKTGNTVKNCVVTDFDYGVQLSYSDSNTLINNTVKYNIYNGFKIYYSDNNDISNNTANNNSYGIYTNTAVSNTLDQNSVNDNLYGIFLYSSSTNAITNNSLESNLYGIYLSSSNNNTANSNRACSNTQSDFYIYSSLDNNGSTNTCDVPDGWSDEGVAGCTYDCTGATTTTTTTVSTTSLSTTTTLPETTCTTCSDCSNKLNGSYSAVRLTAYINGQSGTCIEYNVSNVEFDCQGYTIDGDGSGYGSGIWLYGASNNTIENCVITDFYSGINISVSSNITLTNNTANLNALGIYMKNFTNSTLDTNTACNNTVLDLNISGGSSGNSGSGNTCDNPDGWNDTGTTGCTTLCTATTTTTVSTTTINVTTTTLPTTTTINVTTTTTLPNVTTTTTINVTTTTTLPNVTTTTTINVTTTTLPNVTTTTLPNVTTTTLTTTTLPNVTTTSTTSTTTTLSPTTPSVTATRLLPGSETAGGNLTVTVVVDVNESDLPDALGIAENVPDNWTMVDSDCGGFYFSEENRVEFLLSALSLCTIEDQNITYTLQIPNDALGNYTFSGTVDYGGDVNPVVEGDATIMISLLTGDLNGDGIVELGEVVDMINDWVNGEATLSDAIDAITNWASQAG